jgi:hypothetical protein
MRNKVRTGKGGNRERKERKWQKGIVENPDLILSGSGCGITSLMIH